MRFKESIKAAVLLMLLSTPLHAYAEAVWIDVRTAAEHKINHIEGDIRISYENIVREVSRLYPDKNTEIHLYCRSGRRASIAQSALKGAGYQTVYNAKTVAGARKARNL